MNHYTEAQETVRRIEQELAGWQSSKQSREIELVNLKANAAKRLADGETPSALARESAALADEITFLEQVIQGVQAKLKTAQQEAQVAKVQQLRMDADKLELEAAPIIKRREELLAALVELEGENWQTEGRSILLLWQAQRLRDSATDLEARLSMPVKLTDADGNELRRVVRR